MGALLGEAVVFTKNNEPKHFVTIVKQHGALLAKGRVAGVQFDCFFTNDLYFKLGKHAIDLAKDLIAVLEEKNYTFFLKSPTNQQFVIVENHELERLTQAGVAYGFWEKYDDEHTVVRFATSWSTTKEDIAALRKIL